jgi:hypothetical protein
MAGVATRVERPWPLDEVSSFQRDQGSAECGVRPSAGNGTLVELLPSFPGIHVGQSQYREAVRVGATALEHGDRSKAVNGDADHFEAG